jgi:hypothetical protein
VGRRKRRRIWQPSILYSFVRARQLEGTLNESPRVGVHIVTAGRVFASWGRVSEKRWPRWRKGSIWPPVEPAGLDKIAKYNRILMHYRVRDLTEMKLCLEKGMPVQFVVPIHAGWYSARGGKISNPATNQLFPENHSIVAEKYDDKLQLIRFWNNWGSSWGDSEYGYLPYDYFERYMTDAWLLDFRSPRFKHDHSQRFICRRTAAKTILGHVSALIDLWDLQEDIRIGWCFAAVRGGWFEIEDFFIRPDQKSYPGHINRLIFEIRAFALFFKCRIRYWIPTADVSFKSENFSTVNNLIRALRLNVKPSGVAWAPYRAEEPERL